VTARDPSAARVRRARPEDRVRMIDLHRELARFEKLPLPESPESARLLSWIFDEKRLEAFVAEVGGRIEGMAIFYEILASSFRASSALYLEDLVVSEAARGLGVGNALMSALAREGIARGIRRVDWAVLDWNEGAMRFYRRLGGRHQTEWLRYTLEGDAMERLAEEDE